MNFQVSNNIQSLLSPTHEACLLSVDEMKLISFRRIKSTNQISKTHQTVHITIFLSIFSMLLHCFLLIMLAAMNSPLIIY
jgi:hypothetical protein